MDSELHKFMKVSSDEKIIETEPLPMSPRMKRQVKAIKLSRKFDINGWMRSQLDRNLPQILAECGLPQEAA